MFETKLGNQLENQFVEFIQSEMQQDLAHDMNHVLRVVKTAKELCASEGAVLEVVLPAAYLHDCFSFPKNHPDRAKSSQVAANKAVEFLASIDYPSQYFEAIHHAIVTHSFSANIEPKTLEAQIVQDADRLDALGAIGIARCIQVSSSLGVSLYDAEDPFSEDRDLNDRLYTIDHFYTKLFKLKDTMNTLSAKAEAEKRTVFMEEYLKQLGAEI
ncbi:HD domain-containing protein [Photobacterium sp. ZSDE20]|uniref:HD domain-containing protein n=1 Tax=Photobacterium pectinilyticum TaxID=2906793 RepID=A0ABT1N545_9GAMM|nr:HD domain-containing protein [Photobacterium sp. ZSDE20]MCQ1059836.1 HD domain-containing protein [Photobacterium sp. ZSDE20]MDD1826336.1 HD domain-containing protein [Photobacterium sp. ZSDE20]